MSPTRICSNCGTTQGPFEFSKASDRYLCAAVKDDKGHLVLLDDKQKLREDSRPFACLARRDKHDHVLFDANLPKNTPEHATPCFLCEKELA